ncbi:MAG: hypothetical protein AAFY71_15420 [Bacteroidota bacterium]
MKRIQLFEFEDFEWLPTWMRTAMTNVIVVLHGLLGIPDVLSKLVAQALQQSGQKKIVDMGSGSGGAMPAVMEKLAQDEATKDVEILLTDLYPNPEFIEKFNQDQSDQISYSTDSLDATNLSQAPEGLKTMVNSFHHMPPDKAKGILQTAHDNKQPLLIYEMAENNIPTVAWWIFLPLGLVIVFVMALFLTPFSKPTPKQLLFTYLIPIIPIFYAWDGQASLPRMYTFDDIDQLLEGLEDEGYRWEKGQALKEDGKPLGYYVMGMPA